MMKLLFRLGLLVCGVFALALGNVFRGFLPVLDPAAKNTWHALSVFWSTSGGLGVIASLVPGKWMDRVYKIDPENSHLSSLPSRLFFGLAGFGYLLSITMDLAPLGWHPAPKLVLSFCPACALTVTVDPSFFSVLVLLAPVNAALYGLLGGVFGYLLLIVRGRVVDAGMKG